MSLVFLLQLTISLYMDNVIVHFGGSLKVIKKNPSFELPSCKLISKGWMCHKSEDQLLHSLSTLTKLMELDLLH